MKDSGQEWRDLAQQMADGAETNMREFEQADHKTWPYPVVPGLPYTERDRDLVLLRLHVARGQITPETMRRMRARDLQYLAGSTEINEIEAKESDGHRVRETKIVENSIRAHKELERRAQHRSEVSGVVVGFVLAMAAQRWDDVWSWLNDLW